MHVYYDSLLYILHIVIHSTTNDAREAKWSRKDFFLISYLSAPWPVLGHSPRVNLLTRIIYFISSVTQTSLGVLLGAHYQILVKCLVGFELGLF